MLKLKNFLKMSKFVKICTSRSPYTPNCPHPKIGNISLPPHNPPHFPKKSNDLVLNTPKLNNFNNLIA